MSDEREVLTRHSSRRVERVEQVAGLCSGPDLDDETMQQKGGGILEYNYKHSEYFRTYFKKKE